VAELTGSRRKPRLVRVRSASVEAGRNPGDVLADILKEGAVSTGKVCVSLAGEGAVVRRLVLPLTNARTAHRAVRYQAEELLCGESLEDVIVEHEVVGPALGGGTEVLVLIVKKRDVASALSTLAAAGIGEAGVTLDGAALFNLLHAAGDLPKAGRAALLHFDGPLLRIVVARDRKLEIYRVARPAAGSDGENHAAQEAVRELERTLAGIGTTDPLDRIWVTGTGSEEAVGALSERFRVSAGVLDPGRALGGADVDGALSAPVAAGAALKGMNAEELSADFRKEEFAPRGQTRKVVYHGLYAAGALVLLFGILFANAYRRYGGAEADLRRIVAEEKKVWKTVFPKKSFPRVSFDRHILKLDRASASKGTQEVRYASFLEALRKIADASPGEGLQVQGVSFDQQKVVLAGEVDSIDRFESLTNDLKARFGVRVKPTLDRRRGRDGVVRTLFKIEIPRGKEVR
jgi:type II secretory pathway component PulL